ncbi:low temperature requirement protein A [Streptomyces sp. NPDC002928]|uniref:low temperature requirement protein A n=1 Tax=Streptomyces sp. NPDC002928 TaxID=3154440 RepID=UPI0033A34697
MSTFLVCAPAIPRLRRHGGVVSGLGFLAVVVVHTALCTRSHGWDSIWSAVTMRMQLGSLDPAHFMERHGLLLIVAFGESVIAIGIGIGDLPLTAGLFGGAFLSLALVIALWWTYFVRDEELAEAAFRRAPAPARFRLAMNAYHYALLPMLLGHRLPGHGREEDARSSHRASAHQPRVGPRGRRGTLPRRRRGVPRGPTPLPRPLPSDRDTRGPDHRTVRHPPVRGHRTPGSGGRVGGMPAAEARWGVRSAEFQDLARA